MRKPTTFQNEVAPKQGVPMIRYQIRAAVSEVCSQCAEEAGGVWPTGHVATMSMGKCDVCYFDRVVCSPGDWNWPNGRPRHWIGGRD